MDKYSRLELNANDIISDTQKTLHQWIFDAYKEAVKEGIKANTVLINKHFAKVNRHAFLFNGICLDMPPMICGLEVKLTDELPEGYDFVLCEDRETERDRLIANTKAEVAREIFAEIDNALHDMAMEYAEAGHMSYYAVCEMVHHKVMRPIEKKYIGEQNDE